MKRTTIMMPARLKLRAEVEARRLGVSMGQLIRQLLEKELAIVKGTSGPRFFPNFDFSNIDEGPTDLSANLDKYLDQWDAEDERSQKSKSAPPTTRKKRGAA